jgi:glycosyltransferase involved in cell wall biosynthesis
MLTHSYYEEDPRVRREAEALVESGRGVDVLALRRPGTPERECLDGVSVHRLPVHRNQGAPLGRYLAEYADFFARSTLAAARLHRRRRYGLVQVHTLPDPLVFAVSPLRMLGVPVLLDLHEAMPEFFRSRFPAASRPAVHAGLLGAEHASIAFASHVLTVNEALADRLVGLGVPRERVTVILNSPRADRFDPGLFPARPFMADGILRLVYAGALTPLYQLELVVEAIAMLARSGRSSAGAETPSSGPPATPETPIQVTLDMFGRGDAQPAIEAAAASLGVADRVTFHGRIPIEDVPARIADADAGLAPTRRDEFTDFSLSTKIFEYAAMGKPVIASRLPTVERYFGRDTLWYFEPGDARSLAASIRGLVTHPDRRGASAAAAAARVRELAWEREASRYVALVDGLAGASRCAPPRGW